jgi:multiple sugar transport system ATP-binding protein
MASVTYSAVDKIYPDGTLAVKKLSLDIPDGGFTVLVGPSGCGKTTALRMCAGLEQISNGELSIDGEVINTLDPGKRDVAMVFQNYALYPHMSVFENIAFPLRATHVPKSEVKSRVQRVIELLDLKDHAKRKPGNLSGGQRQRVAMGRAIVRQPKVFLMDEPLSNLDAKLRVQMRAEISQLQHELGVTTLYVTHDQTEAMTMGSQMAVMRKGVLQQAGSPQDIYSDPANLFVAEFVGSPAMTLVNATIEAAGTGVELVIREQRLALSEEALQRRPVLRRDAGRRIVVGLRPEHMQTPQAAGEGQPRLRGKVALVEPLGPQKLVHVDIDAEPVLSDIVLEIAGDGDASVGRQIRGAEQHVRAVATFDARVAVEVGAEIDLAVPTEELHFFDPDTGMALRA